MIEETVYLYFGWSIQQWLKAIEYYELCEKTSAPAQAGEFFASMESEDMRRALQIQQHWKSRRRDEPNEIQIELAAA
jgi:hypothetical protein